MLREYELTLIIDAHLSNEEIESVLKKYTTVLEKGEGKIHLIDRWGKRRLVYELAKKQYGFYVYIRFASDGAIIQDVERQMKLDDQILRYLTIRLPKIALKQEETDKQKIKQTELAKASAEETNRETPVSENDNEATPAEDKKPEAAHEKTSEDTLEKSDAEKIEEE